MDFGITDGSLDAQTHVVEPHGELDLSTAAQLNACLIDAVVAGNKFVIVDLEDVGFIDSTALGVMLSVQRRLQAAGGALIVVCNDRLVSKVFAIAGLTEVLNVQVSRRHALERARDFAPAG